ncbi:hypothetical protein BURKHO8Y_20173 [Burkholderia sp. 8Y]|nr:hypothetical protein BURKHO8Y_20173 [Burkholderia sp. 8Y]
MPIGDKRDELSPAWTVVGAVRNEPHLQEIAFQHSLGVTPSVSRHWIAQLPEFPCKQLRMMLHHRLTVFSGRTRHGNTTQAVGDLW